VNATNNCVAGCNKGNGSAADTASYTNCLNNCIAQNYFTATGTPASPTGGSGSGSGSGSSGAGATTGTGTAGASGASNTASGAATSSTHPAAAGMVQVGTSAVGLVGFLAAFLAI